jgi:hypothetical protein
MAIPRSNTIQPCLGQSSPPFPWGVLLQIKFKKKEKRKKKGQTLKT